MKKTRYQRLTKNQKSKFEVAYSNASQRNIIDCDMNDVFEKIQAIGGLMSLYSEDIFNAMWYGDFETYIIGCIQQNMQGETTWISPVILKIFEDYFIELGCTITLNEDMFLSDKSRNSAAVEFIPKRKYPLIN